jgi:hypothetical protein
LDYRSRATLLGLPLLPIAFGVLIAVGGIAAGGMTLGGLGVGFISLAGLAVGFLALGGLVIGFLSAGGSAIATKGAVGGLAVARDFALGGLAVAEHRTTRARCTSSAMSFPRPSARLRRRIHTGSQC